LLSAVAIPRYIETSGEREYSLRQNISGRVKNAWVLARADNSDFPTVTRLASYVRDDNVSAKDNGIVVRRKTAIFMVPTYHDSACLYSNKSVNDTVRCVGSVYDRMP